jgi:hypothetical protein
MLCLLASSGNRMSDTDRRIDAERIKDSVTMIDASYRLLAETYVQTMIWELNGHNKWPGTDPLARQAWDA